MDNKQNKKKEFHDNVQLTVDNLYKYVQSEKLDCEPITKYKAFINQTQKYKQISNNSTIIIHTISDDESETSIPVKKLKLKEPNNNFKKTNDPSKIKSSKKRTGDDTINLTKQIEVIDLTLDESPAKKQLCDNKENCALNYNKTDVPEPTLFVEIANEENNQLPNVEIQNNQVSDPENTETQPQISSSEDNIPVFTFRGDSDSPNNNYELDNAVIGRQKIVTMKNFDIMKNTKLISKRPLFYRFQDQEFNIVRIVGTIRGIEPTTTSKTILTIDDGSFIKVIFENSNEKHVIRDKVLELVNRTSKREKLSKKDLIKYGNMPEVQYVNEMPQEIRHKLMDSVNNILAKKLHAKLEIQYPRRFVTGQQVEIVGRLLPRNPKTFIYSEDPYIIYVHYLKKIVSENDYMYREYELRNNIEELIIDDVDEQTWYVDILDDPNV